MLRITFMFILQRYSLYGVCAGGKFAEFPQSISGTAAVSHWDIVVQPVLSWQFYSQIYGATYISTLNYNTFMETTAWSS
jgi:hypothetical protein